ncbi:coiled-coil domain-containing protein 152-like [Montipora capricornis]|uniref:coiled-coil domain-containing protein 152-like n=1 Tax=Montipora capricornis TaxID=246305 RepID=UPI0035F1A092
MATNGKVKRIDLDHLIQEFTLWQKTLRDSVHENNCLQMEIRSLMKKVQSSEEAEKIAREEAGRFKDMVDKLQEVISKRCDYEDQNEELRKQIAGMKDKSSKIEEEHKKQISEALKNLETADQVHKEEVLRVKKETLQQSRGEIDTLKKSLKESADEVQQLQKQLTEVNRANHTEIVKLQLEYDAKLQKLQRNCVRTQSGQASNVNNDIFRKKLQFAKAEAQKEIAALKSKVSELERKLSLQQMSAAKRKRF